MFKSALVAFVCSASFSVHAVADDPRQIDIPAGELIAALKALARQTGAELVYRSDQLEGLRTQGAAGSLSPEAATQKLLEGTPLILRIDSSGAMLITLPVPAAPRSVAPAPAEASFWSRLRLAQVEDAEQAGAEKSSRAGNEAKNSDGAASLSEVTVTGSRIRGAPPASPTIEISQRQMIDAGQATLGDVIRSIPQNFSGGQNPGVQVGASSSPSDQNLSGGSALNLRGLGPDATLTLLNGRRLAYDSFTQAVDISVIPLAALDRIEIVADGASAIYGSDAVAGVANVILKRDYDGISGSARVARSTDGGDFQRQYGVVGGSKWSSGGFILTLDSENDTGIDSTQRDYTRQMPSPTYLLPTNQARAALFSGHQAVGASAELSLDMLYQNRESDTGNGYGTSFYAEHISARNYTFAPELAIDLPARWSLSFDGLYGHDGAVYDQNSFDTLADQAAGNRSFQSKGCYCNDVRSIELSAEGPLVTLPAGEARAAVGGGFRKNDFSFYDEISALAIGGERKSYYGYAELMLPLLGKDQGIAFVDRLVLTGAARYENHDDFGGVATPKLGLVYAPTPDLELKGSWGKSFKAPTLVQEHQASYGQLYSASQLRGVGYPSTATVLYVSGGNPNLTAERANTWTTTLALHPLALPAFRGELSYFNVAYRGRVVIPVENIVQVFTNAAYQEFLTYNPTPDQQQSVLSKLPSPPRNVSGLPYDPANTVMLINSEYTNVASQKIHGVDLSSSYRFDIGGSALTLSEQASWIDSEQQNSGTAPVVTLAGTTYHPARFHARAGAAWERGSLIVSAFYNYAGGVTDTAVKPPTQGASMGTIDLAATYRQQPGVGSLRGIDWSLSMQNLTNRQPPLLDVSSISYNYDSTNYSIIGRFVSFGVTAHW
ncbi:MAG: TonB-dependent receptor [Gammaproteobacteria bacterium]